MTEAELALARIFFPYLMDKVEEVKAVNRRFAHYTSAETAFNILKGEGVWMRNAVTMNDFSEVQHGTECLMHAWSQGGLGADLKALLEPLHPGVFEDFIGRFDRWKGDFLTNTFITCFSEHLEEEDALGRLSMWRAYGNKNGVALVIKNTPFMAESDALGASSSPVAYLDKEGFGVEIRRVLEQIAANEDTVRALPAENLSGVLFAAFRAAVLCTKHPGFHEEREWRVIYSPNLIRSTVIVPDLRVVNGVPQQIHIIPLRDAPEDGLHSASVASLVDRIIIGPSNDQLSLYQAFVELLASKGVPDPAARVVVSDIPLRQP